MKIKTVTIHNFRSIKEATFNLNQYSVLLGANNAGKSNLLTALRIFYEDSIKYNDKDDFPKLDSDDDDSWVEIEYQLTDNEYNNLKAEYQSEGNRLKVRKYFKASQRNRVKANQSNIYAYEGEGLSDNLFYGAKNISEAKLGNLLYIPEVAKTDDTMKLTTLLFLECKEMNNHKVTKCN